MAHVVTEPCHGCKYTDCVAVCPVDCFYEGELMLFINPEECIDCGECVPVCPVEAIYKEENVPDDEERPWRPYIELNAEMAKCSPNIREKKTPLAES